MGGRGDDVRPLHGILQQTGCDESCGVSHVYHQQGTHLVGNLAHPLVVPLTAIGRATADDELGFVLQGEGFHLVIVHTPCLLVQVVADGLVEDTARVDQ